MKRWPLWIILIASLIGIVGSLLATRQYFQILQFGFENKSFCNINEFINCDVAYASSYAKMFGIPASWMGFCFYLFTFLLGLWLLKKETAVAEVASLGWLLSLGGVLLSIQKAYISFTVLKVLCLICTTMYVVNLILLMSWHSFLRIGFKNFAALSFKPKLRTLLPLAVGFFGVGFLAMSGYQSNILKERKLGIPTAELLQFHFNQSEYQFEVDPATPVWGNPNAKITLVEFSDFQCPYCRRAAFLLKPVLSEYKDKIRFYFYHYPIDQACNENINFAAHDKSCMAAQAGVCAQAKGDFWSYHDELFYNQKNLGLDLLLKLAKERGWDEKEFQTCIDAPETLEKVKQNISAAEKIHVDGTPTLLLNNRRVKYWMDPDVFRAILEEEIKRQH